MHPVLSPCTYAGCFQSEIIYKKLISTLHNHGTSISIFEFQTIQMKIKISNFEFRSEIKSYPKSVRWDHYKKLNEIEEKRRQRCAATSKQRKIRKNRFFVFVFVFVFCWQLPVLTSRSKALNYFVLFNFCFNFYKKTYPQNDIDRFREIITFWPNYFYLFIFREYFWVQIALSKHIIGVRAAIPSAQLIFG